MMDKFRLIPAPLQKQILLRLTGCGAGLLLGIYAVAAHGSWKLAIPGILLSVIAFLNAITLYWDCVDGKIILLKGICIEVELTRFKKQLRSFTVISGEQEVRIMARYKTKRQLEKGSALLLYLSPRTAVYELDGSKVICDYLAVTPERNQKAKLPD